MTHLTPTLTLTLANGIEHDLLAPVAALRDQIDRLCTGIEHYRNTENWSEADEEELTTARELVAIFADVQADARDALQVRIDALDNNLNQALTERDTAEGWADGLADLIGKHFGRDIGEHSSAHCPWQEAKEIIEDAAPAASEQDARLLDFVEANTVTLEKEWEGPWQAMVYGESESPSIIEDGKTARDAIRAAIAAQAAQQGGAT